MMDFLCLNKGILLDPISLKNLSFISLFLLVKRLWLGSF